MRCEECGIALYQPGDTVPAGTYVRVDDGSLRRIAVDRPGPLPATFDGHIATYRSVAPACACRRCRVPGVIVVPEHAAEATPGPAGGHNQV